MADLKEKLFIEQDKDSLLEVLESGRLHMGDKVKEFEKAFAQYVGVKHAVAVSSGTAGLHIALRAGAVGPKEEVIVPPIAPVGGPNSVFYQGAVNIFADVDPETGNVDPEDIKPRINSNTRAVILHHYAGQPCRIQPVLDMVKEKDIPVIVDAAYALGAEYGGRPVAAYGDMVVFDFGPGNHIYTGDGGMVTTDDDETAQWLRIFRDEGFVKNKLLLTKDEGPWHYEMQDLGFPYRMTDLQAALGLSQLQRIDGILARRKKIAQRYNEALADLEQVQVPREQPGTTSAWGLYVLKLKPELAAERRRIYVALKAAGVDADVKHYPVFLHPYYIWAGHPDVCTLEGSRAPRAEEFYQRIITLPISAGMIDKDVQFVIDKVREVIKRFL
ncbi:MAG: DegT/DnrJ/EryC1/StrS family aminotransferase [Desulfotomaculum sp.]|nr:DegT/DnrJ/EryC1/StrS family aminotransferase [Desulfotomaculum sp.]